MIHVVIWLIIFAIYYFYHVYKASVKEKEAEEDHFFEELKNSGKDEEDAFIKWIEEMPQCTYVSQHIAALQHELILMSHLDVMLSMDSANMHLASLVNTPVVSVWGATHPMAGFMGWNQSKDNAVQIDMDCRPCSIYGQKPCIHGDFRCMTNIRPEMIVQKILKFISC